uniref:RNA exonuclease 1 homolog n=1 Tax=Myxine glutinosa TaxID=7769 RepID=UPI00358EC389
MLPTRGYFRTIDCPFFVRGNCERPHCHFKHADGDELCVSADEHGCVSDPRSASFEAATISRTSESLEEVKRAIAKMEREQEMLSQCIADAELASDNRKELSYSDAYNSDSNAVLSDLHNFSPSGTFDGDIESRLSCSKYSPTAYTCSDILEYNPTPIRTTSKYTLDSPDENGPNHYVPTVVTSSQKYVIDRTKPTNDLEYDPLLNFTSKFSTHRRSKSEKKSTSLRLQKRPLNKNADKTAAGIPAVKRAKQEAGKNKVIVVSDESEEHLSSRTDLPTKRNNESEERLVRKVKSKRREINFGKKLDIPQMQSTTEPEIGSDSTRENNKSNAAKIGGQKEYSKLFPLAVDKKGKEGKYCIIPKDSSTNVCKDRTTKKGEKRNGKDKLEKKSSNMKVAEISENVQRSNVKVLCNRSETKEKRKNDKTGNICVAPVKATNDKLSKHIRGKHKCSSLIDLAQQSGEKKARKSIDMNQSDEIKTKECRSPKKIFVKRHTDDKRDSMRSKVKRKGKKRHDSESSSSNGKLRMTHQDLFGEDSGGEEESQSSDVNSIFQSSDCAVVAKSAAPLREDEDDEDDDDNDPGGESEQESDINYLALLSEADLEEGDPMEECLRIFNESLEVKKEDKGRPKKEHSQCTVEDFAEGASTAVSKGLKKRIAHVARPDAPKVARSSVRPHRPTPQQVCQARLLEARQQAAFATLAQPVCSSAVRQSMSTLSTSSPPTPLMKKRVAHAPSALLCTASVAGTSSAGQGYTNAAMLCKTTIAPQKRMAHIPSPMRQNLKHPIIVPDSTARVPVVVRQRYLNTFIDEFLKQKVPEHEAFDKGLSEEKTVYERSTSKAIYLNVAVNTLKKLRSRAAPTRTMPAGSKLGACMPRHYLSHEAVLGGKAAAQTSFTINRSGRGKPVEDDLSETSLINRLKEYILTEEDLRANGYPRPHPDRPGIALLFAAETKKPLGDPLRRICCRCGAPHMVTATGDFVRQEECNFHFGKAWRYRVPGGWEMRFSCCQGAVESPGCQMSKNHVTDGRKDNLEGFVRTIDKLRENGRDLGIYAIDCEMCYTKHGLELTRVTVVDSQLKVVYDTFVRPDSDIVDYNTRFSGVTEGDLSETTTTIRDVQAVLLSLASSDTIFIGHSLESDLFALKLIHSTVIDTAVVFPHRLGPPYKRALKNLMADHLKRIIQDSLEGHDSGEDARACMELMLWKIKEDAKLYR